MKWISIQQAIPKKDELVFMYYRDETCDNDPHLCFGTVYVKDFGKYKNELVADCRCEQCCAGPYLYVINRETSRFYWMYEGDVPVPGWQELEKI